MHKKQRAMNFYLGYRILVMNLLNKKNSHMAKNFLDLNKIYMNLFSNKMVFWIIVFGQLNKDMAQLKIHFSL